MENYFNILTELLTHVESEIVEFKKAANQYDKDKLGKYLSALSNEANLRQVDFSWLVLGVANDKTVEGTQFLMNETDRNLLKHNIAANTTDGITFREIIPVDYHGRRVLMFKIPAAPRSTVVKFKGIAYGRNGESLEPLSQDKIDELRYQSPMDDWSAHIVEGATIKDLDEVALAKARVEYKKIHTKIPESRIDHWSVEEFLTRSGAMIQNKLTRTALLLLGKEESAYLLSPAVAQITWTLTDEHDKRIDYTHFTIPFILTVDHVLSKVRNLTMREMPGGTLFPDTMQKYDDYTMREALHNCIAHQDYLLQQRINLQEFPDYLIFANGGEFIPGTIEQVLNTMEQQRFYRNRCLCQVMFNFNMIDTISHGIQRMFDNQRERHFPMPDYFINHDRKDIKVKIYGKAIDDNYTQLLKADDTLSLKECIWLDAVQKRRPITEDAVKKLRQKKLIEGRRPNYIISVAVARKTHQLSEYTQQKGLSTLKHNNMILEFLQNAGRTGASRAEIINYIGDTLPKSKEVTVRNKYVSNLLSRLKGKGKIINRGNQWMMIEEYER